MKGRCQRSDAGLVRLRWMQEKEGLATEGTKGTEMEEKKRVCITAILAVAETGWKACITVA